MVSECVELERSLEDTSLHTSSGRGGRSSIHFEFSECGFALDSFPLCSCRVGLGQTESVSKPRSSVATGGRRLTSEGINFALSETKVSNFA